MKKADELSFLVYVNGAESLGRAEWRFSKKVSWLPIWFPLNRKRDIVFVFDEAPETGADVIVIGEYDA